MAVTGSKSGILLALGDSLAVGYQPADGDNAPPVSAVTGARDQGYPGSYAAHVAATRHFLLIDLVCPGETTASMTRTPAEPACLKAYKAGLGATNQLDAAKRFIAENPGRVKIVTLDLGADNVDGCVSASGAISTPCTARGESEITKQLPQVLTALRKALTPSDPGALVAGMNYYDPFLGAEYDPGGLLGAIEATRSLSEVRMPGVVRACGRARAGCGAEPRSGR